jgi:hypothetical protein
MKPTLIIISIIFSQLFSQQGKYIRKSVSSLESVWYKPGSMSGMTFDSKNFDRFIDFYIETPRFDYNVLPSNLLKDFRKEANSISEITPEALSEVLERTVTDKIIEILNSPAILQGRGNALKSESSLQSFAATKAKSLGLTTKELATLMNSAYIYLPFISSLKKESEDAKDLTITIEGGIIWWQMKVEGDGSVSVDQVVSATTTGISSIDPTAVSALTKEPIYNEFKFGSEKWKTTPEQYAQNDASLAFCKNLGVKTKEIDDFKLSAQIAEAVGREYGFPLGFREGVHLDDGFNIVEFEENAEGEEVSVKVGFVRVSETGDNNEDPTNLSQAKQLLGSSVSEGSVLMEHPRLGMQARFNMGMTVGSVIKPEHTSLDLAGIFFYELYGENVLLKESNSQLTGNLLLSYNLAPIIGVTQTFLDLDIGFGIPIFAPEDLNTTVTAAPFILSPYFGLTKKFGGKTYFSGAFGGGVDMLNLAGTYESSYYGDPSFVISIMAPGVKLGGEFGLMLTSDLLLVGSLNYKLGLPPLGGTLTIGDYDPIEFADLVTYEDMSLGGITFQLGVAYELGELPINVFGFLDPFKKH